MNRSYDIRHWQFPNFGFLLILFGFLSVLGFFCPLKAAIVTTGNISPTLPWTSSTYGYVGNTSDGSLLVDAGSKLQAFYAYIGYNSGVTGAATVTGAGSKWINNTLLVGVDGAATLTVADGGEVTVQRLFASLANLYGNGTINATKGAVLDADFRFDAAHPSQTTLAFGSGGVLTVAAGTITLGAGYRGNGSLTIAEGVAITSSEGFLGYRSGSSGTATVTGAGSTWINSSDLYVGRNGTGTLRVEAGGQLSNSIGYLGYSSGSSGIVTITGAGSKWINNSKFDVGYSGSGTLCIEAGGQLNSNSDAVLGLNSGSSGMATVAGADSKWINLGALYVGYFGDGTLDIEAGGQVSNSYGYLGNIGGASGAVTVNGAGSMWINRYNLYVGEGGSGTLRIEAGGQVSNSRGYITYYEGSSGTVVVTGTGSTWNNSLGLDLGGSGRGILHIRDGGVVTASSITVFSDSLLTLDVGYGSNLQVGTGTGTIGYYGAIQFLTGPQPVSGSQYSPITTGTWSGLGTYQALGGTWNSTSHVFTVSQTLNAISGIPVTVDLTQRQRVLVTESVKNWTAGASFLAKTGTGKSFNFTATALTGTDLTALNGMLAPGQSVLSGWIFSAAGTGYLASDPIYLSLGIPATITSNDLQLWKLSGNTWSRFSVDDLTTNQGYASFTSTGLSNYAATAEFSSNWKSDADGLWQSGSNWTTTPNAPGGVNTAAILGSSITAPRTISLSGPLTLGMLTLNSTQHYKLTGSDPLTLQVNPGYNAKIDVQASDTNGHVIETPLTLISPLDSTLAPTTFLTLAGQVQNPTGQALTLSGGGTLTVSQGIATSGTINVLSGTLVTPSLTADTLTIGSGSTSSLSAVPEPNSMLLFLAAMVGIFARFLFRNLSFK